MPRKLVFALLCAAPAALHAGEAGTAGGDFLRVPVGARETALGGAFAAASSDANSVFYNPAGLGAAAAEISYAYNDYLPGVSQHWLAGAVPRLGGVLGFGVNYLDIDSFASYDAADNRTGSVSAYGLAGYLGYGRAVNTGLRQLPGLRFGAAVKYISEKLASSRASGYGLDAGLQFSTSLRGLTLGLAAENLAVSRLDFISAGARPARTLKAGAAYSVGADGDDVSALLALDAAFPSDGPEYLAAGVETRLYRAVALRAGYSAFGDISNGLSFGLGLELPGKRREIRLDYSFGSSYDLGNVHRFGVTKRFGASVPSLREPVPPQGPGAEADFRAQVDLLHSGQFKDSLAAAEYLAALDDGRVDEHFISLLYSADTARRMAAVHGLSLRKGPGPLEALEKALRDQDPEVRRRAAAALGARGEGSSAPALQEALKTEESEAVKGAILEALGKLPAPANE